MSPANAVQTLRRRFDQFDAFTDAAQSWQLNFLQLDKGQFVGEMERLVAGPVGMIKCQFNRKLQQLGSAPPGCHTFALPMADHTPHIWRRHEVTANDLTCFRDDVEMDCSSTPGFHLFAVSISNDLLARTAQDLGYDSHEEILAREQVVRCQDEELGKLRQLCELAVGRSHSDPDLAESLQGLLPRLMLQSFLGRKPSQPLPISLVRRKALRLALEAINDSEEAILKVSELCRLTGTTERTLRYAFAEGFGMSPKAYLQSLRLNAVRRELLRNGPEVLISDIANRQGFWHMGQFASDYQKMFGELPSETYHHYR
ncbi:helix-turn-helix domain-containing protein [Haloferula sp.]|uniref:helix-turn-helix domain-containing protein n=1 Tax=Haloferula sp. TaxID=2497595 RepID=UPI00329E5F03